MPALPTGLQVKKKNSPLSKNKLEGSEDGSEGAEFGNKHNPGVWLSERIYVRIGQTVRMPVIPAFLQGRERQRRENL